MLTNEEFLLKIEGLNNIRKEEFRIESLIEGEKTYVADNILDDVMRKEIIVSFSVADERVKVSYDNDTYYMESEEGKTVTDFVTVKNMMLENPMSWSVWPNKKQELVEEVE
jgi:hypothetical protein